MHGMCITLMISWAQRLLELCRSSVLCFAVLCCSRELSPWKALSAARDADEAVASANSGSAAGFPPFAKAAASPPVPALLGRHGCCGPLDS